jgi:hypothetical protein
VDVTFFAIFYFSEVLKRASPFFWQQKRSNQRKLLAAPCSTVSVVAEQANAGFMFFVGFGG